MAGYRTPLGRARGLGSAKHGVGHFIAQRVSAAALVFLVLWGVYSALNLAKGDFATATVWLRSPVNAALISLTAAAAFFHMQLGMRVVIEDYIHRPSTKTVLLILNVFAAFGGGALTLISLLKVAFGGGAS